tara:strand:+ start:22 stop:435 length:414 start_codon:yes stop_codon:yes gene_type:complete
LYGLNEYKNTHPGNPSDEELTKNENEIKKVFHEKENFLEKQKEIFNKWKLKYMAVEEKDNKVLKIIVRHFKKDGSVRKEYSIEKGLEFVRHKKGKQQKCEVVGFYPLEVSKQDLQIKIRLKKNSRIARGTIENLIPV